ncbi:MAG: DMT family transporter [Microthrixaceae bacterium]|nr:DMT family transporter [Microthrixaceae bacterium]
MPILLALLSAAAYGVADFLGGTASRRLHVVVVTLISMTTGAAFILVVCLMQGGVVDRADVVWSLGAGVVGSLGIATFYSALAIGPMGVVAPVSAVTSALVPVVSGLALGERPGPLVMLGIGLAFPAIAMVARERRLPDEPRQVATGTLLRALAAGLGFGGYLVLISRTSEGSNLWPVLIGRGASVGVMVTLAAGLGVLRWPRAASKRGAREDGTDRSVTLSLAGGVFDAGGNAFYLLAVRSDLLALVAAVQSLYPAATVGLAGALHGERPQRIQGAGMAVGLVAVVFVAVG